MGRGSLTRVLWKIKQLRNMCEFGIFRILRKFAEMLPKTARGHSKYAESTISSDFQTIFVIFGYVCQLLNQLDSAFIEKVRKHRIRLPLPITNLGWSSYVDML